MSAARILIRTRQWNSLFNFRLPLSAPFPIMQPEEPVETQGHFSTSASCRRLGRQFSVYEGTGTLVGPLATADLRMLFGGLFLLVTFLLTGFNPQFRKNLPVYLLIGVVNSALPFALYSFAALVLPASVEVVANALSPAFGALAAVLFLGEKLTLKKLGGVILGFAGVAVMAGGLQWNDTEGLIPALAACLLAPACYAAGGILVKKKAGSIPPRALAFGSQMSAGLLFLPLLGTGDIARLASPGILGLLAVFGILCSGLAYLLYYGLMSRIRPTKTLTVTFLMPVFGILWGALFLKEEISVTLGIGSAAILLGTWLVTAERRKNPAD